MRKTLIEGVRDYLIVSYLPVRDCVIVNTLRTVSEPTNVVNA